MLDYTVLTKDLRSLRLLNTDGTCFHAMTIAIWREAAKALFSVDLLSLFPQQGEITGWQPDEPTFSRTFASVKQQSRAILAAAFANTAFTHKVLHHVFPAVTDWPEHPTVMQEDWVPTLMSAGTSANPPWQPEETRPYTAALLLSRLQVLDEFVVDIRAYPERTLCNDLYRTASA